MMRHRYQEGDEPIPGYRLLEFLGSGGFGEVWKAAAPGDVPVAIKIVPLEKKAAKKEFRAQKLLKNVRHVNLLPIQAFWLKDADGNVLTDLADESALIETHASLPVNPKVTMTASPPRPTAPGRMPANELIIAMALCDKNLFERLTECLNQGQTGIPVDELLSYLDDAARALDYLNSPRHELLHGKAPIIHCDVKPQNIMLLGDSAVVGDFTLAREVRDGGDIRTSQVGGSTAYVSPEVSRENKPGPTTDQYSLAVSYYELRTGALPFPEDSSALNVLTLSCEGKLDLSRLASPEAEVVRRATSPKPDDRYKTCLEFARQLRAACGRTLSGGDAQSAAAPPGEQGVAHRETSVARRDAALVHTPSGVADGPWRAGDELLPGYTLTRVLSPGLHVRMWEARDARGRLVTLSIRTLEPGKSTVDFRALRAVRTLARPEFVPIEGAWILEENGDKRCVDAETGVVSWPRATHFTVVGGPSGAPLWEALASAAREARTIHPGQIVQWLQPIAAALDALNAAHHIVDGSPRALLHGDVRPGALLLADGRVRLSQFTLTRALEDALSAADTRFEPDCSDPAMALGGFPNPQADQFSLALTYAQLRAGQPLHAVATQSTPYFASFSGWCDATFMGLEPAERAIMERATGHFPPHRYPSCVEMMAELAQAVGEPSPPAMPAPSEKPATEPAGKVTPHAATKATPKNALASKAGTFLDVGPQSGPTALQGSGQPPEATRTPSMGTLPPVPPKSSYSSGDAPVPGYTLVHKLGAGSYGQVWEARAPGGAPVAIKIVPLTQRSGMLEVRALDVVKTIRHRSLVEIQAYWLKDASGAFLDVEAAGAQQEQAPADLKSSSLLKGTLMFAPPAPATDQKPAGPEPAELVIAMSLCGGGDLENRLQESRQGKQVGLPPDELLGYMRDAAEGIDYLNNQTQVRNGRTEFIRHCDIKPANLLLRSGNAVVGDFTLTRGFDQSELNVAGEFVGGTLAYISPEVLNSQQPGPTTDQYSLAVSYYELLTGELPFTGEALESADTIKKCIRAGALDFSGLEGRKGRRVADALRRATATDPKARFESCVEFVQALEAAPPHVSVLFKVLATVAVLAGIALVGWELWPKDSPSTEDQIHDRAMVRLYEIEKELDAGPEKFSEAIGGGYRTQLAEVKIEIAPYQWDDVDVLWNALDDKVARATEGDIRLKIFARLGKAREILDRPSLAGAKPSPTDLATVLAESAGAVDDLKDPKKRSEWGDLLAAANLLQSRYFVRREEWAAAKDALDAVSAEKLENGDQPMVAALHALIDQGPAKAPDVAKTRPVLQAVADLAPWLESHEPETLYEANAIRELGAQYALSAVNAAWLKDFQTDTAQGLETLLTAVWDVLAKELSRQKIVGAQRADWRAAPLYRSWAAGDAPPEKSDLDAFAAVAASMSKDRLALSLRELGRRPAMAWQEEHLAVALPVLDTIAARPDAAADLKPLLADLWVRRVELATAADRPDPLRTMLPAIEQAARNWGGHPRELLVRAALLEGQFWSNEVDPAGLAAARKLAQGNAANPSDENYFRFVEASIAAAGDGARLAEIGEQLFASLQSTEPPQAWAVPFRRQAGAKTLVKAAAALTGYPKANLVQTLQERPAKEQAAEARQWLEWAKESLGDGVDENFYLQLAVATYYGVDTAAPSPEVCAAVCKSLDEIEAESLRSQTSRIHAEALRASSPEKALERYLNLYGALLQNTPAPTRQVLFVAVVQPSIELAEGLDRDALTRLGSQAAQMYANWARWLETAGNPEIFRVPQGTDPAAAPIYRLVLGAYDKAIELDPRPAGEKADYFVARGLAKVRLDQVSPATVAKLVEEDIVPWQDIAALKPSPRAHLLLAQAKLLEQRQPAVAYRRRVGLLDEALAECEKAVNAAPPEDRPDLRVWHAAAMVEKANLVLDDKEIREWLNKAEEAARLAIEEIDSLEQESASHVREVIEPNAHIARGNAFEDFGWLLGDVDRWAKADEEFGNAFAAAGPGENPEKTNYVAAEALYGRGRCRWKWANAGGASAADRESLVSRAENDLRRALDSGSLAPHLQAETNVWLGWISQAKAAAVRAADSTDLAGIERELKAADEHFAKAAGIGVGEATSEFRMIRLEAAVAHARGLRTSDRMAAEALFREALAGAQALLTDRNEAIHVSTRAQAARLAAEIKLNLGDAAHAAEDAAQAFADAANARPPGLPSQQIAQFEIDLHRQFSALRSDWVFARGARGRFRNADEAAQARTMAAQAQEHAAKAHEGLTQQGGDDVLRISHARFLAGQARLAEVYAISNNPDPEARKTNLPRIPNLLEQAVAEYEAAVTALPRRKDTQRWRAQYARAAFLVSKLPKDMTANAARIMAERERHAGQSRDYWLEAAESWNKEMEALLKQAESDPLLKKESTIAGDVDFRTWIQARRR